MTKYEKRIASVPRYNSQEKRDYFEESLEENLDGVTRLCPASAAGALPDTPEGLIEWHETTYFAIYQCRHCLRPYYGNLAPCWRLQVNISKTNNTFAQPLEKALHKKNP